MRPTGVASAAWVFAAAPSKVPFYVAGSVLAFWAVVVAVTGITHPDFPGSGGRARVVMLTSALLVAATLTTAVATGGGEGKPAATAQPVSTTLQLAANPTGLLAYDKKSVTVTAGKVAIRFANASPIPHDVTIALGTKTVAQTRTIMGSSTAATANLPPGTYVYFCSVDAHRQAGMQGKLTVR